ncbi:MAG TPA: alpha/beta fold hydrolase [Patescibacteria group bacterium]|nr:alpha/beta fold hydrolase [Patescibacteria group bacterium]
MFKIIIPAGLVFIAITIGLYMKGMSEPAVNPVSEEVSYFTSDGVVIVADWYKRTEDKPPVAILLHMLGSDRSSWYPLALKLNQSGYAVLAPDWRGHGRSTKKGTEVIDYRLFEREDFLAMDLDVHAAFSFLDKQNINRDEIHVIGASIGANAALIIGAEIPIVRSVVMLSPAEDYRDVQTIPAAEVYKGRPALIISSSEDEPSYSGSQKITQVIGSSAKFLGLVGAGHGTQMILSQPDLIEEILQFIKTR